MEKKILILIFLIIEGNKKKTSKNREKEVDWGEELTCHKMEKILPLLVSDVLDLEGCWKAELSSPGLKQGLFYII